MSSCVRAHPPSTPRGRVNAPRGGVCVRVCESETLLVELQPVGAGPPASVRFRGALKTLLRRHGLRCVDLKAQPPEAP